MSSIPKAQDHRSQVAAADTSMAIASRRAGRHTLTVNDVSRLDLRRREPTEREWSSPPLGPLLLLDGFHSGRLRALLGLLHGDELAVARVSTNLGRAA